MDRTTIERTPIITGWRVAGWGSLLALLLLPALAMRFTNEVVWTTSDFVFAAVLLAFIGTVVEIAVRMARPGASRIGYIIAGLAAFLTFWINAAVGIIGDDNAVNSYFFIMIYTGLVASVIVWFRPAAMRWIAGALAIGQYGVGVAAFSMMPGHDVEWGVLTFFALFWLAAAWCFHRVAARKAEEARNSGGAG